MKVPNILAQAAQVQSQNASAKRTKNIWNAVHTLGKNQMEAIGALGARVSEYGSRLAEVAVKTTKRFDFVHQYLFAMDEKRAMQAEFTELTARARAALRGLYETRDQYWDALYADYTDNHYEPLKQAYEAARVRHREEASATIGKLQDAMTKKSMALRKLAPESEAGKRARAAYKVWRDAEFQPKVNAAHDAREKADAEAQTTFYNANRAAHAAYMVKFNAAKAQWEPKITEAKALIADLDEQTKKLAELDKLFLEDDTSAEKPNAGVAITISDSNGTRREVI